MEPTLRVRGASEHNLRSVDLELPRGRLIVFTGVSGSGKSSLAFDTLYAESQRRFVEALAPGARARFGASPKPAYELLTGLVPAIGVAQRGQQAPSPRATVGTLTEIHDLLRVLWTRKGQAHCPRCDRPVHTRTVDQMARSLLDLGAGARVTLYAPLARARVGALGSVLDEVRRQGFSRVRVDGVVSPVDEQPPVDARAPHDVDVVVDRVRVDLAKADRLTDSLSTAVRAGRGTALAEWDGGEAAWSVRPRCSYCDLDLPPLTPRLFSFNTPPGACPACEGLGLRRVVDPERLVLDAAKALSEGALEGGEKVLTAARGRGISVDRPWSGLPWEERDFLLSGGEGWEGAVALVTRRAARADAPERLRRLVTESTCTDCDGARLAPMPRHVRLDGRTPQALLALPLGDARAALAAHAHDAIAAPILEELDRRLSFLLRTGLGHLSLDRAAPTLSAGELQRVRLGAVASNQLSGVLYVLDEPTAGLHPRDTAALVTLLQELRDAGNTVLVVEHDADVIAAADHVVDFGPGAGREGGRIVYEGPPEGLWTADTPTGRWLSGRERLEPSTAPPPERRLWVRDARGHNLQGIDVALPMERLVGIGGVGGAGKSSLLEDTLGRALSARLYGATATPLPHRTIGGAEAILRVVRAGAGGPARSARSNAATFAKVWDPIRQLYARTNEAKVRGWGPEHFSLGTPGGRCEACAGEGVVRVEMHYLPELRLPCEVCEGRRFEASTLGVTFRGANLADVLEMPVREARALFANQPSIVGPLAMLDELGLGYLPLGQPGDTLSGGEAQRLGLARELGRRGDVPGTLYLLDEPTVGLHPADVAVLVAALRRLVEAGGTVVAVEHDPAFLAACDWEIELGPGAGPDGGRLVYEGPARPAPLPGDVR